MGFLAGILRSILERRPALRSIVTRPIIIEYDAELERMRDAKRREWLARGYPEKLVDMAIMLAEEYADRYTAWIIRTIEEPELRAKTYRTFFKYGLDTVAENWIRTMAGY